MRRIQKPRHLLRRFALDAHGQAKAANLQVRHRAIQHPAKQIRRLLPRERPRTVLAAAYFLDVFGNAHD